MKENFSNNLGFIEGWLSIVINILLFAGKLFIGILNNSVAIKADAYHTLSDSFTSIVVIFGFWIANKPPDKKHPFGHQRAEQVAAIIVGVLLFLVGLNFLKESFLKLKFKKGATFTNITIIIFLISVILKELLAIFSIWAGKKIKSQSLIADGWHHRSDAIASLLILIGSFAGNKLWFIDSILGILVSFLILYAGYEIIRSTSSIFMGEDIEKETKDSIIKIINEIEPRIKDIHHFHIHSYGSHKEITLHLRLPGNYSIKKAHNISEVIESRIRKELGIELTVHIEPMK